MAVLDANGTAVTDAAVTLTSDTGEVLKAVPNADGVFVFESDVPMSRAEVVVTYADGSERRAELRLDGTEPSAMFIPAEAGLLQAKTLQSPQSLPGMKGQGATTNLASAAAAAQHTGPAGVKAFAAEFDDNGATFINAAQILRDTRQGSDDCSGAEAIAGAGTFGFDNTAATSVGPDHAGCLEFSLTGITRDVWFCWTSDCDGIVVLDTCSLTTVDTKIAVYDGCVCPTDDSTLLDCNDDTCNFQSRVSWTAVAGNQYLIRIGTYPGAGGAAGGAGQFRIACQGAPPELPCDEPASNCQPYDNSDALNSNQANFVVADDFTPAADGAITSVCWWGGYLSAGCEIGATFDFRVTYYADNAGLPGAVLGTFDQSGGSLTVTGPADTGDLIAGIAPVYEHLGTHAPVAVTAGQCYWVEISHNNSSCTFYWSLGTGGNGRSLQDATPADPYSAGDNTGLDQAFCVNVALGDSSGCVPPPPPTPCEEPAANCQAQDPSDAYNSNRTDYVTADDFTPAADSIISGLCWWGAYFDGSGDCQGVAADTFRVRYFADNAGLPGALLATYTQAGGTLTVTGPVDTGGLIAGFLPEYEYSATHAPLTVTAGSCYWVEISNQITGCSWYWELASAGNGRNLQDGTPPNGYDIGDVALADNAFCLNIALGDSAGCIPPPPPIPCEQPEANCQTKDVSDALNSNRTDFTTADDFTLPPTRGIVTEVCWWGGYYDGAGDCVGSGPDTFIINYYANNSGAPGALIASFSQTGGSLTVTGPAPTGDLIAGFLPEYNYTGTHAPLTLVEGECYWIEISNQIAGCSWFWTVASEGNGYAWQNGPVVGRDLAFCLDSGLGDSTACLPPPPPNDECDDAISIACGDSVTADNTFATDNPGDPIPSCGFGGSPGANSLWYSFVATDVSALVSTCNSTLASDSLIAVYSGTCGSLTEIGCSEDATGCGLLSEVCVEGLTVGETYYIQLKAYDSASAGVYDLAVECPCPGVPVNDLCEDAIGPLPVPSSTAGTTDRATTDTGAPTCGSGSVSSPGVWYTVTGTGNTMTASLCDGSTTFDSKLSVFCGDCSSLPSLLCLGGNDDFCGLQSEVSWCSQNGATYLILVHGFGGATGDFVLDITDDGVPCTATVSCLPTGACCVSDDCSITTEADCDLAGGRWLGAGTDCGGGAYELQDCSSSFEDISGTGTAIPLTDDSGQVVPIGFTFSFFGTDYTDIGVASNGYLAFGAQSLSDLSNDPIPTAGTPNNLIAVLWDDLNPGAGGSVQYQLLGSAPNRRLIVQWTNVPQFSTADSNTFQAVLYEGTNCIELRYGTFTAQAFAGDYTIGIEDAAGTTGINVDPATVAPGDCLSFCFVVGENPCSLVASFDLIPQFCPNMRYHVLEGNPTVVPAAILGSTELDAMEINASTVTLRRADGIGGVLSIDPTWVIQDVATPFGGELCGCTTDSADGFFDFAFTVEFATFLSTLEIDLIDPIPGRDYELIVAGEMNDGTPFEGRDCFRAPAETSPEADPIAVALMSTSGNTPLTVSPADLTGQTGGDTPMTLSYEPGKIITITAPARQGNRYFRGWRVNGVYQQGAGPQTNVIAIYDAMTVEAVYSRQAIGSLPADIAAPVAP